MNHNFKSKAIFMNKTKHTLLLLYSIILIITNFVICKAILLDKIDWYFAVGKKWLSVWFYIIIFLSIFETKVIFIYFLFMFCIYIVLEYVKYWDAGI